MLYRSGDIAKKRRHCKNVRYGTRLTDWSAYAKVIALILLILTGFYFIIFTNQNQIENFKTGAWKETKFGIGNIVIGLYQGLFSYSGWDTLNFLVEELQDPYNNMPKVNLEFDQKSQKSNKKIPKISKCNFS